MVCGQLGGSESGRPTGRPDSHRRRPPSDGRRSADHPARQIPRATDGHLCESPNGLGCGRCWCSSASSRRASLTPIGRSTARRPWPRRPGTTRAPVGRDRLRASGAAGLAGVDGHGRVPTHAVRPRAVAVVAAVPGARARVRPPARLPGSAEPGRPVPLARPGGHHVRLHPPGPALQGLRNAALGTALPADFQPDPAQDIGTGLSRTKARARRAARKRATRRARGGRAAAPRSTAGGWPKPAT